MLEDADASLFPADRGTGFSSLGPRAENGIRRGVFRTESAQICAVAARNLITFPAATLDVDKTAVNGFRGSNEYAIGEAMTDQELFDAVMRVRENAYSEYSGFSVGAALIDDEGNLHVGCNVENSAYPEGTCAEANAIASMIAAGRRKITVIAVAGGHSELENCTPCGGCRQKIAEFADKSTRILVMNADHEIEEFGSADLLPRSFHLEH